MIFTRQIHVVDRCSERRAEISYVLTNGALRPQIYESIDEFEQFVRSSGFVLLNGDEEKCVLPDLRAKIFARGKCLPIAMYSSAPDVEKVVSAMLSGALDYLKWPFNAGLD